MTGGRRAPGAPATPPGAPASTSEALARALRAAVLAQHFERTADHRIGDRPVAQFPSIDLALVVFRRRRPGRLAPQPGHPAPQARQARQARQAVWANVLFSREHPRGLVAAIPSHGGPVRHLRFDRDLQDAERNSIAWAPGVDWRALPFQPLTGRGPHRFVVPYPASLLKLMVAVGVGLAVDQGRADWPEADIGPMITISDNEATDRCVALLHRAGVVDALHERFAALGLPTLQLNRTTPAGGWRNGDGSGVGQIHMTAWDTVRLLWLLDAEAPPPPWLAPAQARTLPLLLPHTRDRLRDLLEQQQHNEILTSHKLRGLPGWVDGLPASVRFAHKTGTTENYGSDAGIIRSADATAPGDGLHAIVAVISNLGTRYAGAEGCATTWRMPALGAALHRIIQSADPG